MSGDRWEDPDEQARNVNDQPNFWTPLYRFGKLCTIQFERVEANDEDVDDCFECFPKKIYNVTGSGDRNRAQLLSDEAEDASIQKRRYKRQRCRRHHWPARRHSHKREADDDESEGQAETFHNWRGRRENLPGYLQEVPDEDFEEIEIDERGKPVEDVEDGGPDYEEEESKDEVEEPFHEEVPEKDDNAGNQGVCTCPIGTFTKENFHMQWNKLRSLVGRCYPALPCRDEDYYLFPQCPPVDDGCKREKDEDESSRITDSDHNAEDDGPTTESDESIVKSDVSIVESDVSIVESDARHTAESTGPTPKEPFTDTIICYTPPFWAKFFQIVILAPLFAFTAYLFYEWFVARRAYNKRSAQLKRLKKRNEALHSESSRLEAYLMSAQMSPLVNGKSQAKAKEEAARICQSLNEHKLKMRQFEEERSVLLEVLFNLRKPEEDRGDRCSPLPIFTNFNRSPC